MSSHPVPSGIDRLSALLERFRIHAHLFHTGPLCGISRFHEPERGFLHVQSRNDDMIIVGGENVHPQSVTEVPDTVPLLPGRVVVCRFSSL